MPETFTQPSPTEQVVTIPPTHIQRTVPQNKLQLILVAAFIVVLVGISSFYLGVHTATKNSDADAMASQSQLTATTASAANEAALTNEITNSDPVTTPKSVDETENWSMFSDEEVGITFKHPSSLKVSVKKTQSTTDLDTGYVIQVGNTLSLMKYRDTTKTSVYKDLLEEQVKKNKSDLPPINIGDESYPLSYYYWGDGHPSNTVADCNEGVMEKSYFTDVPDLVSVSIVYQKGTGCDPTNGQYNFVSSNDVTITDLDAEIKTAYTVISTIKTK